jgi:hypothetical protein
MRGTTALPLLTLARWQYFFGNLIMPSMSSSVIAARQRFFIPMTCPFTGKEDVPSLPVA